MQLFVGVEKTPISCRLRGVSRIIEIFKELIQKDYCVIVVTHDMGIAKQTDIVYKMTDGKLDTMQ